jgi:DNA repair exonuclease SbcCD ATPase subunit
MIDVLLPVVLFVSVATLAIAIGALLSSRRSQTLAEDRYELLRDQQDRLELLREERRMLIEELAREFKESQQFIAETHPDEAEGLEQESQARAESARGTEEQDQERLRLKQELEQERQARAESARRAEEQEQERLRLEQEHRRLEEELERASRRDSEIQQRIEQLEQERLRLEQEPARPNGGPDNGRPKARPWWRQPQLVVALLLGSLVLWFTSLLVALNLLNP